MGLFRKKPYIVGLASIDGFDEKVAGPGVGYLSPTTTVVAIAIKRREYDAYLSGFRQIPGMQLEQLKLDNGVEGWRCREGPATAYLLASASCFALLNVGAKPGQVADMAVVEAALHTLEFR